MNTNSSVTGKLRERNYIRSVPEKPVEEKDCFESIMSAVQTEIADRFESAFRLEYLDEEARILYHVCTQWPFNGRVATHPSHRSYPALERLCRANLARFEWDGMELFVLL